MISSNQKQNKKHHMKKRLDVALHEMYPQYSRRQLQSWIMQGHVKVEGQVATKAGMQISDDVSIVLDINEPKYVSRAGFKLEKALNHFSIDVSDLVVLDAGLSTGGFTDCLLQHGVRKVYGIDVGYGQVHEKIRNDDRVVVLERTNLRHVREIGEKADLITLDLSFISVLLVMDAIKALLKKDGMLIVLIKPQFEAERHEIGRGGIIRDAHVHKKVVDKVVNGIALQGFTSMGVIESPILGSQGNKEFIGVFKRI